MRNFKKILIAVCVMALLVAGCVVFALAEDEAAVGTVEELTSLIEAAENASETDEKYSAVLAIAEYLDTYELDTASYAYTTAIIRTNKVTVDCARVFIDAVYAEGVDDNTALDCIGKASEMLHLFDLPSGTYGLEEAKEKYNDALVQTANIFMASIDENIETTLKTASNQIAINKMSKLMRDCSFFGDENPLAEVEAKFEELRAAHERAVAANLKALDEANSASNYDLPIFFEQDWEKMTVTNAFSHSSWTVDIKGIANQIGIQQDKNTGNKYFFHRYREKENPQGTYAQLNLKSAGVVDAQINGVVFEFDICVMGSVPEQGIQIETGSIRPSTFPPYYFYANGNGDICTPNKEPLLKGALVTGEWLHIIIALEPTEFVYKLYVAGEYIATYDAKYNGTEKFEHGNVAFRLSGGASTSGEVCFDNFLIYSGPSYRNHDRLENMTEEERFSFYVDFFNDDANDVVARKDAYYKADASIGKYWIINEETGEGSYAEGVAENETLKNSVDTFLNFDIGSIIDIAKAKNLSTYIGMVESLAAMERKVGNIKERNALIAEIAEFVSIYETLMDLVGDYDSDGVSEYEEYNAIYNNVKDQVTYDTNSELFVRYMQRFDKSTSLSAMQRYYDRAKLLVDEGGIDLELILNPETHGRENFTDLINAYETYKNSEKRVDAATKINRSEKIVLCMNKISSYRDEAAWEANSEEILKYINLVKEYIIYTDNNGGLLYDGAYEGIKAAVDFFDNVYGYFFIKIQNDHVAYISDILERISATDSYVSKIGMVALVERYLDTNEINYEDPRIITLISNIETCKSELELRREDYAKVLVENATYFINYVENMRTAKTYAEQKAYYEQAAVYYFSIDVTVEGAKRAVSIFDEYKIILERTEDSTVKFLEAVAIYNASETADDKYAALVECYYHAQYAEPSYEGVAEAMATYQAAYDSYMGYVTAANADMASVGGAVASLRATMGITTIIAIVIKKIFGI